MAKAESKTILKAYSTVESKLPTLPLEDGQLIFVYDKKKIILDNHGVRTVYEQIQTIETEEQRNDLLAPIDSFYFVIETSILWRYSNGHWNQITTSPQEQIDRIATEGTKQVKAVQDKGAEVLQSIPEDFQTQMETKLNKQQGIENKGKALVIGEDGLVVPGEVQSGGRDGIAIINTMSGESPLAIPDSAERTLERLELGGKTTQMSTRGVNLWSKESKITFTATKQVVFDTPIPAGDYVVSANVTSNDKDGTVCLMLFYYTDSGSKGANLTRTGRSSAKITFTSNVKHVVLYAGSNANGSANDTATFADIQLEKGSTATAYEPYTGGKPSPSPEYPQEIKSVGKWNEGTQKYEVDVKVTGKNLLNLQKEPDVKGVYQGWKVGNGELLTLGVKDKGNNADIKGCYIGFSDQGSESKGVVWFVDNGVIKTNPLTQRKAYVSIFPANETAVKKLTERLDIQCELGNVATPYQPYKEQTLTITSDRPLTKWDRLVEQGGQIGWLYSTGVYEDIKESDISANGINDQYGRYYVNAIKAYKNAECMCNIAEYSPAQKENKCGFWWNDTLCFLISSEYTGNNGTEDNSTAIKNFKDNVLSKGITVFYKLNTEEFIPLPQSEQNAIRALETYYPTTVITADGGELDPDIKVTYTADTKNYIDNKFGKTINAMQTKLLELESRV